MNLIVHSIMYFYYACSALNIYWPGWARQSVTTLQLSQMVRFLPLVVLIFKRFLDLEYLEQHTLIVLLIHLCCSVELPCTFHTSSCSPSYFINFTLPKNHLLPKKQLKQNKAV